MLAHWMMVALSSSPTAMSVPRVDGTLQKGEWSNASRFRMDDGGEIWVLRDRTELFVAVRGTDRGYPSLCIGRPGHVEILHASAALGAVTYERERTTWRLQVPFVWSMRSEPVDPVAKRRERARFFRMHGWLSTASRSDSPTREFRIRSSPTRTWLGVVYLHKKDMHVTYWPHSMGRGCRDLELVKGNAPDRPSFVPTSWHPLR